MVDDKNSIVKRKGSLGSILSTGSSTVEKHSSTLSLKLDEPVSYHSDGEESTVVVVDGISAENIDENSGNSLQSPDEKALRLAQPSYSELFDSDKINLNAIRLRTDLNRIMNGFTADVSDEIPVLRYSQEIQRKNFKKPEIRRTRQCEIL